MIRIIYRKLLPDNIRMKIGRMKIRFNDRLIVKEILRYYKNNPVDNNIKNLLDDIKKNGMSNFPYDWAKYNYDDIDKIDVYFDDSKDMHYVLLDNKKLYYPKDMNAEIIKSSYYFVQIVEQHKESPHRYLNEDFNVDKDDIVVDCGVAEGNFSLSIVEKAKHIYLFEADDRWIEALNATFEPWNHKITIVKKYVSDKDDENNVSLDKYFKDKEKPNFIKLDVEGYEKQVIEGSNQILKNNNLKIVACTYHYQEDYDILKNKLENLGYITSTNKGYMLFWAYDEMKPPYFRRAVIKAIK